jgi:hypothetical protein
MVKLLTGRERSGAVETWTTESLLDVALVWRGMCDDEIGHGQEG